MTWQRRKRIERAVARAVTRSAPVWVCGLLGGCVPDGEVMSRHHPRLAAGLYDELLGARGVPAVGVGRCGRCGRLIAHDGVRWYRGR